MEKRRIHADLREGLSEKQHNRVVDNVCTLRRGHVEQDKRVRREIANSNERRRMKSINAGFDTLRLLLPPLQDGEKMSKATILQVTANYVTTLLSRIATLESELATLRQSPVTQTGLILPQLSETLAVSRKRRTDDTKKRSDHCRARRRRVESRMFLSSHGTSVCSPTTPAAVQNSPTSFTGSASVSPTSPQLEITSDRSARLEHLVMAIEQLEGGRAQHVSPGTDSQGDCFSSGEQSPPICSDGYWQTQDAYNTYSYADRQNSNLKNNLTAFPDMLLAPITEIGNGISVSPIQEDTSHQQSNADDYPIVARLLNRPIPHKYLHRPQVIVNSSH